MMKSSDSTRNGEEQYHYRITVTTTDATPSHQQLFSGSDKDPKSRDNYLTTLPFLPSNAPFFENAYRSSRPSNPWEQFRFPSLTHQNVLELPMSFGPTPTYHRRMASMAAQMHAASTSNTRTAKTALKKNHPWAAASTRPRSEGQNVFAKLPAVISVPMGQIEALGPPHLQIFKVSLPFHAANTFQRVIDACEDHAWHRLDQWETNLYSLTKQDIAVADVPGGLELVKDIQDYVVSSIRCLYHQPIVHMDRNQPHVLKYDGGTNHRSVPLHHDQCHVTVNLMMSASTDYAGGGTYLADLDQRIMLEKGEFLLHPGHLIHKGCEITSGTRYLMVFFVHFPSPPPPSVPANYYSRCRNMPF